MMPLPLFAQTASDADWIITSSSTLTQGRFIAQSLHFSAALADKKYAINLCEDRLNFMRGFAAVLMRGQTLLLPSNRSPGAIAEIADDYGDCYVLTDGVQAPDDVPSIDVGGYAFEAGDSAEVPEIAAEAVAAIVFTSGSTGRAQPNVKTWGNLVRGSELAQRRFGIGPDSGIVATVPPQHMYGLETSVLLPMLTGAKVFGGRPFFPEDIRQALLAMPGKRVLVTTPIHLRACVASRLEWPELDMIISATAPLDVALAEQVEALFRTSVMEIYGCTEAGSMASRQTSHDSLWQLYDDFQLRNQEDQAIISAPHLDGEVRLGDLVEQVDERHFRLLGRHADMLNIAGKRASLNDLNLRLNAIPGVEDGVFVVSGKNGRAVSRLTALVVAPERTEQEILDCLARELDPVFLPRPLYRVDALPRNETGKLPRHSLLGLLDRISGRS